MNFKVSQLKSLTAGEVAVDDLIYVIDSNPTDGSVKSKKVTVGDLIDSRIYGISSSQFVLITGYYADPSWITSLDWSKITNAPSFVTSLSALTDVSLSSPVPNQLLRYNGTSWYNWTPTYYSLPAGGTTLQYIDGTGALQTLPTTLPTSTVKHLVKAGVPITKGQAVYVTSADGTNMIVGLASNASEATSSKTMGLLDATVSTNGFANVVTEGLLAGLDTTGANAAGDPVWLGTNGNLIYGLVNKPYAPNHLVFIGIVTRRNANNGEIFVKVQNGFELSEIHDVDARNPDNNDGIFYNSTTQLWEHKQISSVFPTPTLDSVTTAGNTTTNAITVGLINSTASRAVVTIMDTTAGVNNPSYFGSYDNFLQLGVNRNPSTGVYAQTGKASSQISLEGDAGTSSIRFYTTTTNNSIPSERMRIFGGGNITIGNNVDAGYKLDVTGTGRYSSTLTIQTAASDASPSNSILISTSSSGNGGRISWGDSNTSILRYSNSLYFREYTGNFRFESTGSGAALLHISEAVTTLFSGRFITSGSTTATSALARGVYFNNTLVAAANNDVLVGLDINPTFTNGAFTGVSNYAIRLQNSGLALFDASIYSQAGSNAFNTNFSVTGTAGSDYTIYSSRNFIFNTGQSMYFNTDTDGGGPTERAWYFAGARTGTTGGRTYAAITVDGSGFPSLTIYNNDNGGRIQLNSNAASYFNGGNLLVGTTTDAGYKLDVNGSASINGLTVGSFIRAGQLNFWDQGRIGATSDGTSFASSYNSASAKTLWFSGDMRFGGNTTPASIYYFGARYGGSAATYSLANFMTLGVSGLETFGANSGASTGTILNIIPPYNYTGGTHTLRGIYYNPTLTSMTGVTHRAIETTSGDVIFNGGNVGIGTSTPSYKLEVTGNAYFNEKVLIGNGEALSLWTNFAQIKPPVINTLGFYTGTSSADERMRITTTGNILINTTTDNGYKLQVNGNASLVGAAGAVGLNVDFGNVNSNVKILSHGSSDFSQIQIGTSFSLSRNGGGDPSISTTFGLGIISNSLSLQTSTAAPGKLWIKGNYGLGSAYFGANNSNGVTASTLYFQNSETPTAVQNVLATFNLWGISDNATVPTIPASSMFSLHSTTRGFLAPRMTTAQILLITSPAEGLQVYNTDLHTICFFDGTIWQRVTSTAM